MAASFFFYDLETSGIDARRQRIMQFAGQRTDLQLQPIGEPINVLIKLTPDILPDPEAVLLTGITPQSTQLEGLTEVEFLKYFYDEVVQPDTTFLGYNTVRFDDEFMRALHYRNFYDPYEWQWKDGCSRWDLLDLVRMTRALRPDGIKWPLNDEGRPTNRLEFLTASNSLGHEQAHDALSDVTATIAVARLLQQKQPDLFRFQFEHRSKKVVAQLVEQRQPFVYTSGRYPVSTLHTTAAVMVAPHPSGDAALVYDLRHDPTPFAAMSPEQLVEVWKFKRERSADDLRLPVKTLKYNRCPAAAPLGVIADESAQNRIGLPLETVKKHLAALQQVHKQFAGNLLAAVRLLDAERSGQPAQTLSAATVDSAIYDGFLQQTDKQLLTRVRQAAPETLTTYASQFKDQRLQLLLPLYKARNYPAALSGEERQQWEEYVRQQLFAGGQSSRLSVYFAALQELAAKKLTSQQEYLLEELQLYGESIMPSDMSGLDEG